MDVLPAIPFACWRAPSEGAELCGNLLAMVSVTRLAGKDDVVSGLDASAVDAIDCLLTPKLRPL
jgi:hypothetical protein